MKIEERLTKIDNMKSADEIETRESIEKFLRKAPVVKAMIDEFKS